MFTSLNRKSIIESELSKFRLLQPSLTQVLIYPTMWEEFMPSFSDCAAETDHRERIWFFPDKFWQATKNMPQSEAENLMAEVEGYAAAGDVQALSKYPFVFVGDPYKKKKRVAD
jgi:hypothetical protein